MQILRGLAAIWVVVFHLEFIALHYFHTSLECRLIHVGYIGVHLFFVLSGFIIFWIHDADAGNATAIRSYFLKRIARIYPLLIALNIIKLAYMSFSGYGVRGNKYDLSSILGSFLLLPTTANFLIDVTWSLTYEAWFYLGFGLLLLFGRTTLYSFGIGYGLTIAALNLPGLPELDAMARFIFDPRIIEFIIGCGIAFSFRRLIANAKAIGFILLGVGIISVLNGIYTISGESISPLFGCLYWGTAFGIGLLGSLLLEKTIDFSRLSLCVLIGDASYSIYLAHSLTLNALAVISNKLFPVVSGTTLWIILIICGSIAVISGVICYFLIEYPLLRYFRGKIASKCSVV